METDSLSYKTLKNAGYNFLGYVGPIVFSIFITPVVVHKLGVADYGVYVLVNTIIAFLSLLDLGLTVALVKHVSAYFAQNDQESLKNLLSSANTLYLLIGLMGLTVFYVSGKFLLPLFNISSQSQGHISVVFILAGLIFFLNSINSVYLVVPHALQRYDLVTKINLLQLTGFNLATLVLVLMGYKLKAIMLANLLSIAILTLIYRAYFKKLLPQIILGFAWVKEEIKKAYGFGLFAALSNLASNALVQLDRLIIPIFIGTSQLTFYSLPGNVAQKTAGITSSLSATLFPLTSAMQGVGNVEKVKLIYRKAFRNITLLGAAVTSAIMVFAYPILFFWLGKEFADRGTVILLILAVTYFILALFGPLTHFLLGLGQVKFLSVTSVTLAGVNLVLLLILVPKYGIVGAAWAYLGGTLLVPLAFYWMEKKILYLTGSASFYTKLYGKIALNTLIFYILVHYLILPQVKNLISLIIIGPLSVILYLGLYKLFGLFEAEDWEMLTSFAKKIKISFNIFKLF